MVKRGVRMDPRLTRGALQWIRIESAWLNRKSVCSLGLRRPFSRDLEAATSAHTQKVRAEAAGTPAAGARRLTVLAWGRCEACSSSS